MMDGMQRDQLIEKRFRHRETIMIFNSKRIELMLKYLRDLQEIEIGVR